MKSLHLVKTEIEFAELAVELCVRRRFYFYVSGLFNKDSDLEEIDNEYLTFFRKLKRQNGRENGHFLRFGSAGLVVSREADGPVFGADNKQVRDIRTAPLTFFKFEVSCVPNGKHRFKPDVGFSSFERDCMHGKIDHAGHRLEIELLQKFFSASNFPAYPTIHKHLGEYVQHVNEKRQAAGLESLPRSLFGLKDAKVIRLDPAELKKRGT